MKSQVMKAAHQMAAGAIKNGKFNGKYAAALSWALKTAWAKEKARTATGAPLEIIFANYELAMSTKSMPVNLIEALRAVEKFESGFYNAQGFVTASYREASKMKQAGARLILVENNSVRPY